ncbi:hypothetical protein W97_06560 [Coniosporium apollinis CBS 100218]|uniref:Uncharacterized protein n=1 Tax=Coniosporium apollinis (strain CBS 100218) TaxID=1168221 RepID=R7YZH1_CONA1|nr:uncharacterized protein W97_06560 [Coniosporium apollinis CBS 100218]EON67307.1 hypothetical protein W97_06560 [Coniosporium apollinis CBS 100218]
MAPTEPSPLTWTLRLKHARTTVLLHTDPLQSLSSVKAELLRALRATQPDGTLHGVALPGEAEALVLGKPRDVHDLAQGWVRIGGAAADGGEDGAANGTGKGKGKGKAREVNGVEESVKGAGLRDNAVVAFKWGASAARNGREREGELDDEGLELDEEVEGDDGWDVQIPKYEDTYGVEGVVNGEAGDVEVGSVSPV